MNKLLVICGPTATGKTKLAFSLAKQFHGELISADSRQIYSGMDTGTGKDLPQNSKFEVQNTKLRIKNDFYFYGYYDINNLHIWMLDVARPDQDFSVSHYCDIAIPTIQGIWKRGLLPIVVGGTGFYIKALFYPPKTLHIPPNQLLRSQLKHISVDELQNRLKKIDLNRWNSMNQSDRQNPRRLVRAIEIVCYKEDRGVKIADTKNMSIQNVLIIGLTASREDLYNRIDRRVEDRVKKGIIEEIGSLLRNGYKWNLAAMNTLGYREWKAYFEGNMTQKDVIKQWKFNEHAYARRQLTWFKKQRGIHRFDITDSNYKNKIWELVNKWYTNQEVQNISLA